MFHKSCFYEAMVTTSTLDILDAGMIGAVFDERNTAIQRIYTKGHDRGRKGMIGAVSEYIYYAQEFLKLSELSDLELCCMVFNRSALTNSLMPILTVPKIGCLTSLVANFRTWFRCVSLSN